MINKLQLVLFATWIISYIGLQMSKLFSMMFKLLFMLPDRLLSFSSMFDPFKLLEGELKIINATVQNNEKLSDITNKFKLFIKFYADNNGKFNMQDLTNFIQCAIFYIVYSINGKLVNAVIEQKIDSGKLNDTTNEINKRFICKHNNKEFELPYREMQLSGELGHNAVDNLIHSNEMIDDINDLIREIEGN